MGTRRLARCMVFLALALGGAGCTSAGTHAPAAGAGGLPVARTVTVTADGKVVCVITLSGGQGSCKASTLPYSPGNVQFRASFAGGDGLKPSGSAPVTVRLRQAATTTSLSLSAPSVTLGNEQAERIAVRTVPQFAGTPAGTVTVRAGGVVLCAVTLRGGTGSCALAGRQLPAGRYRLVASYPGSTDFTGSVSAGQALAVTK